jgi:hypothetical protein
VRDELERLLHGPPSGQSLPTDLVAVTATCPAGAERVLEKVREVLRPVIDSPRRWPSPDEWRERLPAWFVAACSDDERVTTCVVDKWSLRAWVWWFQPEQRRWLFWDATVDGDRLTIRLVPTGAGSLLLGTLEWLLKASGAQPEKAA